MQSTSCEEQDVKMKKISDAITLYIEQPKKTHICPLCSTTINKIHDERIQKIKHLYKEPYNLVGNLQ